MLQSDKVILSSCGPLSSEGIQFEEIADGHYKVTLAASRGLPACPNALQFQVLNAEDKELVFEVSFDHPDPRGILDEYPHSATKDFREFKLLKWELPRNGRKNILRIPATGWDSFSVGMQNTLPLEGMEGLLLDWAKHPDVEIQKIGQSILGRPIWKISITAKNGVIPIKERWHHHVVNFHPGEGNARWRMVGMVEELLKSANKSAREESLFEFIPLLCPDGTACGWRRVNADGVDMNRCFYPEGLEADKQIHEAQLYQTMLDEQMRGNHPVNTLWCMHTWPGPMETLVDGLGPEFTSDPDGLDKLRELLSRESAFLPVKPMQLRDQPGVPESWNGGVFRRWGITSVLVEGGGDGEIAIHRSNGAALLRTITEYWNASSFKKQLIQL